MINVATNKRNWLSLTRGINFYDRLLIIIPKKSFIIYIIFFIITSFVVIDYQTIRSNYAHGVPTLAQEIKQFQNNLRSIVNNTINSILGDSDCKFNFSLNYQAKNNDQTVSTSRNYCNGEFLSSIMPIGNKYSNLKGTIVNAEYDTKTGNIINHVIGNWTFFSEENNQIDFESSFIKKSLNSLQSIQPTNQTSSGPNKSIYESVKYSLSDFKVNSISESNWHIKYEGKMDVIREIKSSNNHQADESMSFVDIKTSVVIFNGKTLVINFDSSSSLSKEFEDIPIVGIAK
ncbi:hypothetical protein BH23THE1_BH23THE1_30580 [soil metagenome]